MPAYAYWMFDKTKTYDVDAFRSLYGTGNILFLSKKKIKQLLNGYWDKKKIK